MIYNIIVRQGANMKKNKITIQEIVAESDSMNNSDSGENETVKVDLCSEATGYDPCMGFLLFD